MAKVITLSSKTNAIRIIEKAKITYEEASYDFDENDLNGCHAADAIGYPREQVFKTLVARGPKTGINVFCIPVSAELDLKRAARSIEDKSLELVSVKELLPLTGYVRGGCSPVGMKKQYPTYIHESCRNFPIIAVSAGQRGRQVMLSPSDLVKLTGAKLINIIV